MNKRISLRELLGIITMAAIAMGGIMAVSKYSSSKLVGVALVFFAIALYFYYKPKEK